LKNRHFFNRITSRVTLRTFSMITSALLSTIVVVLVAASFYTFNRLAGRPLEIVSSTPIWLLLGVSFVAILLPTLTTYNIVSYVARSLAHLNKYLLDSEATTDSAANVRSFAELRHLQIGVIRTVGRLRREVAVLRRRAFFDKTAGLPNENALMDAVEKYLPAAAYERPAAMMFLSVEGFGRALEQLGGEYEAALVNRLAGRLTNALATVLPSTSLSSNGVVLAALQSDEFAVFMPEAVSRKDVAVIARALRVAFTTDFDVEGVQVKAGLSGGIVMAPEDADTPGNLLRFSRMALRQVHKDGKTGFRFYTPRMHRVERGRLVLENELRDAVANHEFKAVFQPKVDFATGKITGAEALARWRRPNGKVMSPAAFIPIAEETGLVADIGAQILEQACRAGRIWQDEGFDVNIAVNVSPKQFESCDLTELVLKTLTSTGLSPNKLELEITESMAVGNPEQVAQVMRPLRAMGMRLAIDDFGTGHSNLSMLTQLPFDVFKIDRQFVSALMGDEHAPAIVEMILALASTLGLTTVAEGIETEYQAEFLRERGCTMGQGFLYSPGLPHSAFLNLLKSGQSKQIKDDDLPSSVGAFG
jgi:EAL domain-containing protein (putative c-di-GMP-specific phosphodiesterase class I)/GGDEF domain-containing protein